MWPAQPRPGLNPYRSTGELMHHLLLHAAGNMTTRSLRLIQVVDIVRLAPHLAAADWDELAGSGAWWAYPPLALSVRLGAEAVPPLLLEELRRRCPASLRRATRRCTLTDVSLSNPRIEAFPGIEWTRSIPDAARYAARRIRPSRETRAARSELAAADAWRATPSWGTLPQWRRVMRWICSRPLRVESVHPVLAALEAGSGAMDGSPQA
jgi:hypothetical protein